jgi:hypothetical protein
VLRNRFDQALGPWKVQPAQNRFVLKVVYLYSGEQAEFSKKSFVLAMQRLLASARALASDGSSATIAEPLHEAEEDMATIQSPLQKQLHIDKTSQSLESSLGRRRGIKVEIRKILKLNRDLVARSMVSKAPQKVKKVRTELAKRVRHERSKGQARILISREVLGSFLRLHVGDAL